MQEVLGKTISDKTLLDWAKICQAFHRNKIAWDAEFVLRLHKSAKILNIGGAPYVFAHNIKNKSEYILTTLDIESALFSELIDAV